jgi:Tfp pilus assembly protein PilV
MAKKQLGQSLLEVVFAVSVVGVILAGFVPAVVYFSKTGQVAESGAKATQLAQQKIEDFRSMKKTSSTDFWQTMSNYATATPAPESLQGGKFERSIDVDYNQPNGTNKRAKVEVSISWKEQDKDKNVVVKSYFSEY